MKPPKNDKTPKSPPAAPLNRQQFPQHAQTEATTGRDEIRGQSHIPAPRESQRPVERSAKKRAGA